MENASDAHWILRVAGKEYGPVSLATLLEWKSEGRVIPANEVRETGSFTWRTAADVPGLFTADQHSTAPVAQAAAPRIGIWAETLRIYFKGFVQFVGLTLLVAGPAIGGHVLSSIVDANQGLGSDVRVLVSSLIGFCVMLLTLLLTPVYIAGIQMLTAELHFGRSIRFGTLLSDAVRFWPRVAFLWVFVFVCYAFWTILPVGIILAVAQAGPSFVGIFLSLLLLAVQVWITGRLFINFLFWQQFAVLDCRDAVESLRCSKELARSRGDLPWFRRPMWRGVFIASLWFAFVLLLNWPAIWGFYHTSLVAFTSSTDPQKIIDALRNTAQTSNSVLDWATGLLQAILKPLLGIAFVLLYFDARNVAEEKPLARETLSAEGQDR